MLLPHKEEFEKEMAGKSVSLFYLKNPNCSAAITNYGARVVSLLIPDKKGSLVDVIVGPGTINDFLACKEQYFGAIVGRYANRIANGKFVLDEKTYNLPLNNGVNTLHGGPNGFHAGVWDSKLLSENKLELTYFSPDGDQGFPGNLHVTVTYELTEDMEFKIEYRASTDKKTVINFTNHNFWNLNGIGSGAITNHILQIAAKKYTPLDSNFIPAEIKEVAGTPFDFTDFHTIGERTQADHVQVRLANGYDHNFVLDKGVTAEPEKMAAVKADISGIEMDVFTTEPGMQLYVPYSLNEQNRLKGEACDEFRTAFCLETQHFPNSPNQPDFPSTVLNPGEIYSSITIYKFL